MLLNLVVVLMYAALFATFFFITLYLQQVLGYDALQAGLSFLPMTMAVFTGSSLAPRLVARLGVRAAVTAAMIAAAAGLALFTGVSPGGSYLALVLPGAVLSGLGMGLGLVSSTIAATQGVPKEHSGLASGLLNMSRLFGGALGLAVLSTLAASETHATLRAGSVQALTDGFGLAFRVAALLCVAGALLAAFELRDTPTADTAHAPQSESELEQSEPLAAQQAQQM